jgi:hypothetical protein
VTKTNVRQARTSRRPTSRERYEARKLKRTQIDQCYREHTPPQIRHLRWLRRVGQA